MGAQKKQKQTNSGFISEPKGQRSEETGPVAKAWVADLARQDDAIRVKARHSLVAMGRAAVPLLSKALKSENSLTRWEAAKALGEIGDPATASTLVEALEDEDFDVRWLAAEGLTKMNLNALKPLLQALEKRGDSFFLQEGAHHVFHDLAKGALRKFLAPVLAALEGLEPGEEVPWAARHEMVVEVPWAARRALEMLEKAKAI
jgi:HEAT repeat protein